MTTEHNLNDRYGRATHALVVRRRRVLLVSLVSVVVVAAAVWVLLTDQLGFGPRVTWTDTGHSILSSSQVRVEYTIDATVGREVACAIQAQDRSFTIVGWKVVVIPASNQRMRSFSDTVTTIGLPTTGLVAQCWLT